MSADPMTRALFGQDAVHVPAWMYVQEQDDGMVSFVGASRVPAGQPHPLRYGSLRTHQFAVGEIILRPHLLVATDALRGMGLAGLATSGHDLDQMLTAGERLIFPRPNSAVSS
jgi:hypothetical protein